MGEKCLYKNIKVIEKKRIVFNMGADAFHIDPGVNIVYSVPYI